MLVWSDIISRTGEGILGYFMTVGSLSMSFYPYHAREALLVFVTGKLEEKSQTVRMFVGGEAQIALDQMIQIFGTLES